MTLSELSRDYADAAARLALRLRQLRRALYVSDDAEECWHLRRRISQLQQMYCDTRDLAQLLARYYERGFYHDDRFTIRIRRPEPGPENRAAVPRD